VSEPPSGMTFAAFVRQYGGDYVEVIDGRVVPLPPGGIRHGVVCANAAFLVGGFIRDRSLGTVCSNDTFVLIRKDQLRVRGADLVYWSREKLPRGAPDDVEVPPDLVVEVRQTAERLNAVIAKAVEYIEAGVTAVVVLDTVSESAAVFRDEAFPLVLDNGDELTLPDVLPGFSVPVKRFFE
jgi:Uma2 family endonuclease